MNRKLQPTERKGQGVEENPRNQNLSVNNSETAPCFIAEGAHVRSKITVTGHTWAAVSLCGIDFCIKVLLMKTNARDYIVGPVCTFLLPCSGYEK